MDAKTDTTYGADPVNTAANPQGKGLVPILQQWRQYQPVDVQQKAPARLLADYFTSLLVLSAEFGFKPVVGQRYYLYLKQERWRLSLIEPERWSRQRSGDYLGECQLHPDMTWSIAPGDAYSDNPQMLAGLVQFQSLLYEQLNNDEPLQNQLPYYVATLPFYQRLAANGLAKSVSISARDSGMLAQPASNWLIQKPPALLNQQTVKK